jgi:hypothetical protein
VGEEPLDAGDRMETGYETTKIPGRQCNLCDMSYFVLHLIAGARQFRNLFAMKVPTFRHSQSAQAAVAADDVSYSMLLLLSCFSCNVCVCVCVCVCV